MILFGPEQLEERKALADSLSASADGLRISSQESADLAAELVRQIKREIAAVEAMRKSATKPQREAIDVVNGWFRPLVDTLTRAECRYRQALVDWTKAEESKRRLAWAQAERAMADGNQTQAQTALAVANQAAASGPPQGVTVRHRWHARVVRPADVPPAWCTASPNMSAIERHASECPADMVPAPIPGVEFVLESSTIVRMK